MPRSLATDLRLRVVKAYEAGNETLAAVGQKFSVGEASVNRWVSRWRKTGTVDPLPHRGGHEFKVTEAGRQVMRDLITRQPDATRPELARAYRQATGTMLSVATVGRTLWMLGFTRKKRPFTPLKGKRSQ